MTLINDFFEVLGTSDSELGFTTTIALNPDHIIYSGHFPGHPVTPAVIEMQIVHELLEKHFSKKLRLVSMMGCKFLKILDPNETAHLVVHIELDRVGDFINITARGDNGPNIFFKLNSAYQFI